mgnify:CR=1 FL=1
MRTLFIIAILCAPLALAACKTTVQDGSSRISVENTHHTNGGDFCPPGQAKKGNC